MPCPHCGGTQLEGHNCAFCGAQLLIDTPKETGENDGHLEIPCGLYKGVMGSLTLYDKECVVQNVPVLFKKYETRIPYDKITLIIYERPLPKANSVGHLLFRWEENKDLPVPNRFAADKTTVSTSTFIDTLFFHIFYTLKCVAADTADFRMVIPEVDLPDLERFAQRTDLGVYFSKYSPYRAKAVAAFCKRTGAPENVGKVLIDRLFDARQKEIYDADPKAAIRDLNLIVEEMKRNDEAAAQERAGRREEVARDSARLALEEMQRREWEKRH